MMPVEIAQLIALGGASHCRVSVLCLNHGSVIKHSGDFKSDGVLTGINN